MHRKIGKRTLELVKGDITLLEVDAIVNPANSRLILGSGVAGAVYKRGGSEIQQECDRKAPISVGSAVATTAGKMPAKAVIHAVGPRMGEGDEDQKLASATISSLKVADEMKLKTLAFPAISTGVFGFPMDRCATIMIQAVIEFLRGETSLEKVIFCLYDSSGCQVFTDELARYDDNLIRKSE